MYWGPHHSFNETVFVERTQTNQKAELTAIKKAIEQANIINLKFIHIKSESQYSINMIQKIPEHIKRCWLTKNKSLINTKDILTDNDKKVKSCLDHLRGIAEEHVVSWSKLRLCESIDNMEAIYNNPDDELTEKEKFVRISYLI